MTQANLKIAASQGAPRTGSDHVAPDCRGMNFYRADKSLQDLLPLYMPQKLRDHLEPHFDRLGELAGNRLDELASIADKNGPWRVASRVPVRFLVVQERGTASERVSSVNRGEPSCIPSSCLSPPSASSRTSRPTRSNERSPGSPTRRTAPRSRR